jgi:hypothetical protein
MGVRLIRAKNPGLYEQLKPRLAEAKTWNQLGKLVQEIKGGGAPPAKGKTESRRKPGGRKPLAERSTKPDRRGTKPPNVGGKPKSKLLVDESVHPAVRMRNNALKG